MVKSSKTNVANLRKEFRTLISPRCCSLCDASAWLFQGSEYDPTLSLLYAKKDGCLGSGVKLIQPKFIIPWRYKNRKTGAITWKIIHQCGSHLKDAENETIVVNCIKMLTW